MLPLGISTAAAGLYQKYFLALPLPSNDRSEQLHRAVLVWGGSSSVGSCAIQLAVASGVEVYTTASARNSSYCKSLGAKHVFDYHDDDVEDQIVSALRGKTIAGAYHAVGADGAVQACARIVDRCHGKAIVVTVRGVPDDGMPSSVRVKASEYQFSLSEHSMKKMPSANSLHAYSLCKLDLCRGQQCWEVYLAPIPARSTWHWQSCGQARSTRCRRRPSFNPAWPRSTKEGCQCGEGGGDKHLERWLYIRNARNRRLRHDNQKGCRS